MNEMPLDPPLRRGVFSPSLPSGNMKLIAQPLAVYSLADCEPAQSALYCAATGTVQIEAAFPH